MRSGVLLDTGPLVAYLVARDCYHDWAAEIFDEFTGAVVSCEPVLTETSFLVARARLPATLILDYLTSGEMTIGLQLETEAAAIVALMQRYADVPMSLADACLVRLAELTGFPICTLDSDFAVYRMHRRHALQLISPPSRALHEP